MPTEIYRTPKAPNAEEGQHIAAYCLPQPEATKYLVLLATRSPLVSTEFPSQPAPTTLHSKLGITAP